MSVNAEDSKNFLETSDKIKQNNIISVMKNNDTMLKQTCFPDDTTSMTDRNRGSFEILVDTLNTFRILSDLMLKNHKNRVA